MNSDPRNADPQWATGSDGVEIAWYEDGPTEMAGEAGVPCVLMLMGLGYPAAAWYRQVPALRRQYRLLRVDNRGAGRTGDVPGGPYSVEMMTADAVAVLDAAGVGSAHVIGISMGGTLAQELALSYPDRLRSLILMATHPGVADSQWDEEALQILGSRGTVTPVQAAELSVPYNYAVDTPRDPSNRIGLLDYRWPPRTMDIAIS